MALEKKLEQENNNPYELVEREKGYEINGVIYPFRYFPKDRGEFLNRLCDSGLAYDNEDYKSLGEKIFSEFKHGKKESNYFNLMQNIVGYSVFLGGILYVAYILSQK